ncbi:MAG: nuclear transport factor 2 family protein [Candidatus Sulfotelmatobacter sp.]
MRLPCFCVVVCIMALPLDCQDAGSSESRVVALEKAWNQAYKFRDKKALGEILDDAVILVNDDGSFLSKNVFLASVDTARPSDEQQAEPESIFVRLFGNTAIATGVFRETGVAHGKPYLKRNRFIDTWVKKNDSWVCVAASATPIRE